MLKDIVCPVSAERLNKRAWRVGFLMAAAAAVALPFSLSASAYIAVALAAFNILDGVCNFCVGCIIYTYLILPRARPATIAEMP